MKNIMLVVLLLPLLAGLNACSDGLSDEQMHFGTEEKVRPYAVIIDHPDASPGDMVQVTLLAQTSDPDELDITWRVALDYSLGMYGSDEIERHYRDLDVSLPEVDDDGFLTQTFQWVVPDSALLFASDIPEVLEDEAMVYLAEELIGPEAGSPPKKSAVNAWLDALTGDDLNEMSPQELEATWALADRFSCQVRFRATLNTGRVIDVTRNLGVRYTRRLAGTNLNENPRIRHYLVVAVEKQNAETTDINDEDIPQTLYPLIYGFDRINDQIQVPYHADWTYFMINSFTLQLYRPPYDPDIEVMEGSLTHWYFYRKDQPLSDLGFFVTEDGGEAEMSDLGKIVRIMPDGIGSTFRVVASVRDYRYEWGNYNAVPGQAAEEGIVEFVAP